MHANMYDFRDELRAFSKESLNLSRSFGRISLIAYRALKRLIEGVVHGLLSEPKLYRRLDPGRREELQKGKDDYLGLHPPSINRFI